MKILSWNVNGLRAAHKKGFLDYLKKESPDVLCLQETKALPSQLPPELLHTPGYHAHWNSALRPGYSGVGVYSKIEPLSVKKGFDIPRFDDEGRVLELEFAGGLVVMGVYFPNGKMNEDRLRYKMDFYEEMLKRLQGLRKKGKKIVVCGDYNTEHKPIDLKHPRENEGTSGFLPQEREWIDRLVAAGFIDTFRVFNNEPEQYSWWDMRTRARERNAGWRIDYHFVSDNLKPALKDAFIRPEILGSDHCPVGVFLEL